MPHTWALAECNYTPVLGLFPARIRDISSPRLKAWLYMRRVWNVDTNGNQEKNAMGMKISIPIPASYKRAIDRMDFHNPTFFITGFQAAPIYKTVRSQYINIEEKCHSKIYKPNKCYNVKMDQACQ